MDTPAGFSGTECIASIEPTNSGEAARRLRKNWAALPKIWQARLMTIADEYAKQDKTVEATYPKCAQLLVDQKIDSISFGADNTLNITPILEKE